MKKIIVTALVAAAIAFGCCKSTTVVIHPYPVAPCHDANKNDGCKNPDPSTNKLKFEKRRATDYPVGK